MIWFVIVLYRLEHPQYFCCPVSTAWISLWQPIDFQCLNHNSHGRWLPSPASIKHLFSLLSNVYWMYLRFLFCIPTAPQKTPGNKLLTNEVTLTLLNTKYFYRKVTGSVQSSNFYSVFDPKRTHGTVSLKWYFLDDGKHFGNLWGILVYYLNFLGFL